MRRTVCILALAAIWAAGCGGSSNKQASSTPTPTRTPTATATAAKAKAAEAKAKAKAAAASASGGTTIAIAAVPTGALMFDKTKLTAKAGKITFDFDNPSSVPHAFKVAGKSTPTITNAKAPPLTVTLKPGTYEFICPVDGHAAAGMKGTLIVR